MASIEAQKLKNGVKPLETAYKAVYSFTGDKKVFGYSSELRINSPDLGVLTPEVYTVVANRDSRCVKLCERAAEKVAADFKAIAVRSEKPEYMGISVPVKMVLSGGFGAVIKNIIEQTKIIPEKKLVAEISSDILFEETALIAGAINDLHLLGLGVAFTDYGGDCCPVVKISGLQPDYVFLSDGLGVKLALGDGRIAGNMIRLAKDMSITVIATRLAGGETIRLANKLGADYYTDIKPPVPITSLVGDFGE